MPGHDLPRAVEAALNDPFLKGGNARGRFVVLYGRGVRCGARGDPMDTRQLGKPFLDGLVVEHGQHTTDVKCRGLHVESPLAHLRTTMRGCDTRKGSQKSRSSYSTQPARPARRCALIHINLNERKDANVSSAGREPASLISGGIRTGRR